MSGPGQDLAAELADIAAMLPSGHLEAWARVLRLQPDAGGVSASRSIEALLIEAKPGFAIAGLADRLVSASHATDPSLPGAAIALGLEAAALAHADSAARSSDIVVSGPTGDTAAVRLTSSVISELIHDCRESLLVVSFAAFGVTEVVQELMLAARRGVHIDLVLESSAEQGGALRGSVGASEAFNAIRREATFWTWPTARRQAAGAEHAALHAKLVAADERVALLGSANLTDRALAVNLELGVILRDPDVVRRIVRHFRSLMRPGAGPLEPVAQWS